MKALKLLFLLALIATLIVAVTRDPPPPQQQQTTPPSAPTVSGLPKDAPMQDYIDATTEVRRQTISDALVGSLDHTEYEVNARMRCIDGQLDDIVKEGLTQKQEFSTAFIMCSPKMRKRMK